MTRFCPEAVIFDMDGLLVNSEPVWMTIEQAIIADRGHIYRPEVTARYVGVRLLEFWRGLKSEYDFTEAEDVLKDAAVAQMVIRVPKEVFLMSGARELLAYCNDHAIPCALATGSERPVVEAVLAAHDWGDVFQAIVTGDGVTNGKPHPEPYLLAAARLGVDPTLCLALEDSPTGARSAVAAGMTCFAIPDKSHTNPARFADITPHVMDDLGAVLAYLRACDQS
ncbi:MAG: HAD family phosphatase [Chloroflexota bacterium]|nr:HAD family phosphatase [Chloroflexota bacterium]